MVIVAGVFSASANQPRAFIFSQDVYGYFNLTGVSSRTGVDESASLNQEYSIFWRKHLLPYIDARALMRYHNYGLDQSLGENVWREEYQPSGELIWSHPYFSLGTSVTRQNSISNNGATDLIRDIFACNFSTRFETYPTVGGRYLWNKTYNNLDLNNRNTRDRQFYLNLDYSRRGNSLYYGFTASENQNLASEVKIDELQHNFRWSQFNSMFDKRFKLNTDYNFRFRSQSVEKPLIGVAYTQIPVFGALYSYDPTPELDMLDTLSTLADGNIADPAQPPVDIGSGLIDRNIGVDLGYIQDISALYIYTDRPSGSQLSWTVYLSSDNLLWERVPEIPLVIFNAGFNRYEITFPAQDTRYIKAVNSGANDIVTVLVTEIEALEKAPGIEKIEKDQVVHTVGIGGTYRISEKLQASGDIAYKTEPKGDFRDSRDQIYYTLSMRHIPRIWLTQFVRFQSGIESYKISGIDDKNNKISYSLLARPLETLDISFSASNQSNYQNGQKNQEISNSVVGANGNILKGLDLRGEIGFSRINTSESGNAYNSWTYRVSSTASLTRSLDLASSFLYQSTRDNVVLVPRRRKQVGLNSNYRMTGAIMLRGSYYVSDDNGFINITQDYDINWNLGDNISIGGSANLIENADGARIERYGGRLNLRLSVKTAIFCNYSRQVYLPSEILNSSSIQIGLKSGF